MKKAVEQKLRPILGLPFWGIGRNARLLWLHIGHHQILLTHKNTSKEVGEFILHIDCSWSWMKNNDVIANQDSAPKRLAKLVSPSVVCKSVSARDNGSFELRFQNGARLVVSVDTDPDPHADEYWRLFEPAEDRPHVVVGPKGVMG